jgi:hypothetical protein
VAELDRDGRRSALEALGVAAIVMHEPDAILLLGLILAREMGWPVPVAVRLDSTHFGDFRGRAAAVSADGSFTIS